MGYRMFPQATSRGFSLGSFMMVLALAMVLGFLAIKIVPMYTEFNSVKSSMNAVAAEKFDSSKAVRESLQKRMSINYVDSVTRDDITVTAQDGAYVVSVDYYVDKPLFFNLSVSGHFEYQVKTAN